MKSFKFASLGVKMRLSAILCAVLLAAVAAGYTEEEDLLVLTKWDMRQAVGEFKHLLVLFCKCIGTTYGLGNMEVGSGRPQDNTLFMIHFKNHWVLHYDTIRLF